MVQWLRLHASTAGSMGSIPGQGTKMPHGKAKKQTKKSIKTCEPDLKGGRAGGGL